MLPLGISFFTLQAIAYAVDVHRGVISATRSIFEFALFKSFFPQLVAGPIMRAKDLIYQFQEKHRFEISNLKTGLLLIAGGIFKKTFVGDQQERLLISFFVIPLHTIGPLCGLPYFCIYINRWGFFRLLRYCNRLREDSGLRYSR